MLDLNLIKPGDLVTNLEKTHVRLILKLTSIVENYSTHEDITVETLDTLVLNKRGDIVKVCLYSDLDQLVI